MSQGSIAGLALKTAHRQPLTPVNEMEITEDGIVGNVPESSNRRITFISREQWDETMGELGADLPWHTRRANILVEGLDLGGMIGKTLRIGDLEVRINGETEPCGLMNTYCEGLKLALKPDCRAGVYGSVEKGGKLKIGDTISVDSGSN